MAHVNAQHRQAQRRSDASTAQHGSITAQGNQQVEFTRFDPLDEGRVLEHTPGNFLHTPLLQELRDLFALLDSPGDMDMGSNGDSFWYWEMLNHICTIISYSEA